MKNIFESYNARYLSVEEVANSFISNKDFERLCENSHSMLMGPRGCGKTTLFKMLTPKALKLWKGKTNIYDKINFWGVYIPADKQWDRQLKNFQEQFSEDSFKKIVIKSIITSNVQYSIVNTFDDILNAYIDDRQKRLDYQSKVSKELIDIWNVKIPISPTFMDIKKTLKIRIRDINALINKIEFGELKTNEIKWDDSFFYNYIDLASSAFEIFEGILIEEPFFQSKNWKWALCFDELEIVPNWVTSEILDLYLRSTDQKILFKLATAPLIDWQRNYELSKSSSNAQDKQDFSIIRSWVYNYQSRKDWENFCNNFIISKLNYQEGSTNKLYHIFGNHNLNNALKESEKTLGAELNCEETYDFYPGSIMYVVTKKLAQQDSTFHDFLIRKGIDPTDPQPMDKHDIDSILRKTKPAIVFRYYFFKRNNLRSRKSISLYHGYPFISELTDGNPRVLINLLSLFLNKEIKNINSNEQIPIKAQGKIIQNFSSEYYFQVTNHPEASRIINVNGDQFILTLRNLLEKIGNWFYNRLIKEPFKMDSINCFTVDKDIDSSIIALLKLAIDLGAIQYLVETDNVSITENSIYNCKFRLTYIFYPHFKLPKRTDDSVRLSTILTETIYSKITSQKDINQSQIKWNN